MAFDPSNPHPGFGKDPNIKNEWGHTYYPRYVWPKGEEPVKGVKPDFSKRVLVNNPAEEEEVTGEWPKEFKKKEETGLEEKPKPKNSGWK